MLNFPPFYHKTIKSAIVAFGSIFNDVKILRTNENDGTTKEIEIPLRYISQEKGYARTRDDFGPQPDFWQIVPRMSFWIPDAPEYLSDRNLNQLNKIKMPAADGEAPYYFSPAPFKLTFEMNILTKYEEDMFQIIEQILPFFRPDWTVSVYTTDGQSIEIPFTLESSTWDMEFEGAMEEERRRPEATLTFSAIVYMYGPERTNSVIHRVDIDLEYNEIGGPLIDTVVAEADEYTG